MGAEDLSRIKSSPSCPGWEDLLLLKSSAPMKSSRKDVWWSSGYWLESLPLDRSSRVRFSARGQGKRSGRRRWSSPLSSEPFAPTRLGGKVWMWCTTASQPVPPPIVFYPISIKTPKIVIIPTGFEETSKVSSKSWYMCTAILNVNP